MNRLIIDTASNLQYIALMVNGEQYIVTKKVERDHSEIITNNIIDILAMAKIKINQIDQVIVNLGPGSFTGLRVGVVTAKAIALYANAKLATINTNNISEDKYYLFHNARETYLFNEQNHNKIQIVNNPLEVNQLNPKQYFNLDQKNKIILIQHDLKNIMKNYTDINAEDINQIEPDYYTNLNYKK